ncbi:DUF4249 family protein [Robiginitalea sp. SC105]|uniref:DUF4249 family protein n=1 Tax=Robiginitalea sp. SC105 TaxID=2762332 RepID=UPI00163A26F2|nr:DUF4249 family protein [Robiginitalea sp. SC105]MBC2840148.1 DUF4249 family protein [Robiginitalea sp. SC105]
MKKTRHIFAFFLPALAAGLLLALAACEEVIEVETPVEDPRLVVEGLLRVDTTQEFVPVEIRLTQTAGFFDEVQPASGAEVIIILQIMEDGIPVSTGTKALTELDPGSGIYFPDPSFDSDQRLRVDTVVENDILYTLVIAWQGRRYAAQTRYVPAVPIDAVTQGDKTLFEEDETEVIVSYTDAADRDDYYVFDFGFGEFLPTEDTFYKGQAFSFSYFYDQGFPPGTELDIALLGADQQFFNYMNLLVQQTEGLNNPFQTPVATVRGNVFDVTGIDNIEQFDNTGQPGVFALGYFAIVQEFTASLILE